MLALLVGAVGAGAQGAEADRLTVTFELTLYGDVPETDTFEVGYSACPYNDACPDVAMAAIFCGSYYAEFIAVEPGREVCEGGAGCTGRRWRTSGRGGRWATPS